MTEGTVARSLDMEQALRLKLDKACFCTYLPWYSDYDGRDVGWSAVCPNSQFTGMDLARCRPCQMRDTAAK